MFTISFNNHNKVVSKYKNDSSFYYLFYSFIK